MKRTIPFFMLLAASALSLLINPSPAAAQAELAIYEEDFDDGPSGWVPLDLTEKPIYWHSDAWFGASVAWCGTDDPTLVASPGYGNNWLQDLAKSFAIPESDPTLRFNIQFDSEPGYDMTLLQMSLDGGASWIDLDCYFGNSEGFQERAIDLSYFVGQEATIRFRFLSDGSWSDEDGAYPTDGACRLDWVRLGDGPVDEFDAGLDGWIASTHAVGGGPYRLQAGLGGNPTLAWTAYDLDGPYAGQFPWTPEEDAAINRRVNLCIESPRISVPADPEHCFLEFDVFRELPIDAWVFYDFQVACPAPEDGGSWNTDAYVRYGLRNPPDWWTLRIDLTNVQFVDEYNQLYYGSLITPGATSMKIRLVGFEYEAPSQGWHPPGPFFDNVRVLVPSGGPGTLAGTVRADCPTPETPLFGVSLSVYDGNGAQAAALVTDANGGFATELPAGTYTLSLVTPLGYLASPGEYTVALTPGNTTTQDFSLTCMDVESTPRSIGYWKHEVSEATGGAGRGQGSRLKPSKGGSGDGADMSSPLCGYLDLIESHFNDNAVNAVVVYQPPESGLCTDKLAEAAALLNLHGSQEMIERARQQLMALLLNAAAGYIHLSEVISEDGANVSQAITWCDRLIDDPAGDHELAKTIADLINNGQTVPAGLIPVDTDNIAYRSPTARPVVHLAKPMNPFVPGTPIRFTLPEECPYRLAIHDLAGRLVMSCDGTGRRGDNEVLWNGASRTGNEVIPGAYFLSLEADGRREATKLVILR